MESVCSSPWPDCELRRRFRIVCDEQSETDSIGRVQQIEHYSRGQGCTRNNLIET